MKLSERLARTATARGGGDTAAPPARRAGSAAREPVKPAGTSPAGTSPAAASAEPAAAAGRPPLSVSGGAASPGGYRGPDRRRTEVPRPTRGGPEHRGGLPDHRRGGSAAEPAGLEGIKARARTAVVATLAPGLGTDAVDEARLRRELEARLDDELRSSPISIPPQERAAFVDATLADMLGWGALTPLMENPAITEIMCNSADDVWIEVNGRLEHAEVRFPSEAAYRQVIDRMLAVAGRRVDDSAPMADGRLADGSRINAVIPPLAIRGPVLTIRRFPERSLTVTDLIAGESLSADAAVFLEAAVRGRLNVVVSGGTGTGKTTMLNVLSRFIPDGERVVTIEDAAELRLDQPHVVPLEARPPNSEGAGLVTIRQLVRNALRMRPDRIIVGEVRDAAALDMLQAMNTGHEGSLTTVHANSARDALARIETMVLFAGLDLPLRAIREQVVSALDLLVHLDRRPDGRRVVTSITEVQGREGDVITLQDVFRRVGDAPLSATGLRPLCLERLAERGVTVPATHFRPRSARGLTPVATGVQPSGRRPR